MAKLVVTTNCIGCGACCAYDEEHFEINDETGLSQVKSQENLDSDTLKVAIDACPVSAIELKEN